MSLGRVLPQAPGAGSPEGWKPGEPCMRVSMPEAHPSSLTAGNISGVLTWGYRLKNGSLRCDLCDTATMPMTCSQRGSACQVHRSLLFRPGLAETLTGGRWGRRGLVGPGRVLTDTKERAATRRVTVYILTHLGHSRGKNLLWLMREVCVRSHLEP